MKKILSIIIPVFNEENTVLKILNALERVKLIGNIEKDESGFMKFEQFLKILEIAT